MPARLLNDDREATRRARDTRGWSEMAPADPAEALDADHFGLFLIILLGEVLVEAGQSGRHSTSTPRAAGRPRALPAAERPQRERRAAAD